VRRDALPSSEVFPAAVKNYTADQANAKGIVETFILGRSDTTTQLVLRATGKAYTMAQARSQARRWLSKGMFRMRNSSHGKAIACIAHIYNYIAESRNLIHNAMLLRVPRPGADMVGRQILATQYKQAGRKALNDPRAEIESRKTDIGHLDVVGAHEKGPYELPQRLRPSYRARETKRLDGLLALIPDVDSGELAVQVDSVNKVPAPYLTYYYLTVPEKARIWYVNSTPSRIGG